MTERLTTVHFDDVPVELWYRSRQWFEALIREFDIIEAETEARAPRALLDFVASATEEVARLSEASNTRLHRAYDAGQSQIELSIDLPASAGPLADELLDHIRAAIDFCRTGDLLTRVPEPEVMAFIEWYMGEIPRQLDGEPPRSWAAQPVR